MTKTNFTVSIKTKRSNKIKRRKIKTLFRPKRMTNRVWSPNSLRGKNTRLRSQRSIFRTRLWESPTSERDLRGVTRENWEKSDENGNAGSRGGEMGFGNRARSRKMGTGVDRQGENSSSVSPLTNFPISGVIRGDCRPFYLSLL